MLYWSKHVLPDLFSAPAQPVQEQAHPNPQRLVLMDNYSVHGLQPVTRSIREAVDAEAFFGAPNTTEHWQVRFTTVFFTFNTAC